jgi:inositol hexakisphosphate/diphosphoinositol-pentakisphosphate kinase
VSGFQTSGVRFRLVEVNSRTFWESSSKSVFRANGKSFVCDVNGFSFVKNSNKYYDDCAKILGNMILRELAPTLHIPWSVPFQLDDPPIVPTTFGKMMELRCVVAVIRHGDRTPKQKMKVEVRHPK